MKLDLGSGVFMLVGDDAVVVSEGAEFSLATYHAIVSGRRIIGTSDILSEMMALEGEAPTVFAETGALHQFIASLLPPKLRDDFDAGFQAGVESVLAALRIRHAEENKSCLH